MRTSQWRSVLVLVSAASIGGLPAVAAGTPNGPAVHVPSPAPAPVPSGAPVSLSLTDAVAIGLRDNRTIKSAYLRRVVEKFDLFLAETRFLPRARITAQANDNRYDANDDSQDASVRADARWLLPTGGSLDFSWGRFERLDSPTTDRTQASSLSFSQPLLRGAGLDVNLAPVRIARLQEQMNKLGLEATVSGSVTDIIYRYRALLQAQEQVRLAELSLERARQLLETNRLLIDAGRMASADIVLTQSGVANQEVSVLSARQQQQSSQLALLQILALDPRTNIVAADRIAVDRVQIELDRVLTLALDSRMDILGQRLSLEQARQSLIVATNNRLWDVSIVASVDRQEDVDPIFGRLEPRTDSTVGVRVSIPIGEFEPRANELRASTQLRTEELRYEDLSQAVETQVRDSVQTVEMTWLQLEAARRARNLTAQALELQQEKLKAGRASNFEVLSFQADLRAADTQELVAGITYLNALTALDQQIGSTLDTWRIDLND